MRNIRGNVGYAQPPHLFLNQGNGTFRDVAADAGQEFAAPRVGRGLAYGDFDRDGDVDVLMTTNNGPAALFRNDQLAGNRSLRFRLVGTKSNRDAIGAIVRIFTTAPRSRAWSRRGSSYLSQSELPVTFGVGKRDRVDARRHCVAERADRGVQERRVRPIVPVRGRDGNNQSMTAGRPAGLRGVLVVVASAVLASIAAAGLYLAGVKHFHSAVVRPLLSLVSFVPILPIPASGSSST